MVLWKDSRTDLPELMGSMVIPTLTYRPVIKPGMEIPVAYQPGEYPGYGNPGADRFNVDGFVSGTVLTRSVFNVPRSVFSNCKL